jgi:hypothetical protein
MGPGRCGSTFLWELFRELEFDTGPHPEFLRWEDTKDKIKRNEEVIYPRVIKHLGGFCMRLNEHIDENDWGVEHIFFCLRSLKPCASSKAVMQHNRSPNYYISKEEAKKEAERELPYTVGMGLLQIVERDHPFTMIKFPNSALDPEYCLEKLQVVLKGMRFDYFEKRWRKAVNSDLIHHFDEDYYKIG